MTSWRSELHSISPADIFLLDEWPPCLNMEFTDHKMDFIQTQNMNKWTHGKWPLKFIPPSRLERTFCFINFRWAIMIKHRIPCKDLKIARSMLHSFSQACLLTLTPSYDSQPVQLTSPQESWSFCWARGSISVCRTLCHTSSYHSFWHRMGLFPITIASSMGQ